jgi:hypothetical protein
MIDIDDQIFADDELDAIPPAPPPREQKQKVRLFQYKGRVYADWFVVEWRHFMIYPSLEAKDWAQDNCQGLWGECPIGAPRLFFHDETDATMCFLAFSQ